MWTMYSIQHLLPRVKLRFLLDGRASRDAILEGYVLSNYVVGHVRVCILPR